MASLTGSAFSCYGLQRNVVKPAPNQVNLRPLFNPGNVTSVQDASLIAHPDLTLTLSVCNRFGLDEGSK